MPSDRSDGHGVWVDDTDGPERLGKAEKRRAEQLKRWELREARNDGPQSKKAREKRIKFIPNIVMLEAAARNDLDEVARLLESGVCPDLANEDGLTALHQSCIDGCDDMVKYLVEHNANVNACDNELWTPLHAATACDHLSIIKYLLKNDGNIMALNLDGNLPADVVDENEELTMFLDKEMLKLGYDEAGVDELRLNRGKELLDDLKDSVAHGRSLDIQDGEGATAFHVAAANGWTNVIDFLLENEADFEIEDNDGWQPIHAAAAWGHDMILEILAASGADLDSKTNDSRTPLDLTEETEIIELIEELKTKQVKYPRKGKGVRRKRSNTSNSSIKRTSIHDKSEFSHADTKAEGAALFMQLQNTNAEVSSPEPISSPEEPAVSPSQAAFGSGDKQSKNSSRDESNSSGYVSADGSTADTKIEEKHELKTTEIKVNIDEKKVETENEDKNILKVTTNEKKASIKQSPVPKPPRLGTMTSKYEPQTYINIEIGPTDSSSETPNSTPKPEPDKADIKQDKPDIKQDLKQDTPETENLKADTKTAPQNTELKSEENAKKERDTNSLERHTTATLPKLPPSDKRKAPEPPGGASKKKHPSLSEKTSKKANRSRTRSSESSSKKHCIII